MNSLKKYTFKSLTCHMASPRYQGLIMTNTEKDVHTVEHVS